MATNVKRYCVFCDKEVKVPMEATRQVAGAEGSSDGIFVHVVGVGGCGRNQLIESNTYTMGDADPEDR